MKKYKILVIEDSQDIIEDLPRLMETYGIMADATSNLSEAFSKIAEVSYDCVILDIKMPPSGDINIDDVRPGLNLR